jgi:hypothetical protein
MSRSSSKSGAPGARRQSLCNESQILYINDAVVVYVSSRMESWLTYPLPKRLSNDGKINTVDLAIIVKIGE